MGFCLFFCFFSLFNQFCYGKETNKRFVIVIPSYNNKDWYQKNLGSIFSQEYDNYRVIYIADGSSDGTAQLVEDYLEKSQQKERVTLIKNSERKGPLACMCQAIFSCDKDEIVVDLDGNDWLAHEKVLSKLNIIYTDPEVWMTYGQFIYFPSFKKGIASKVPSEIIDRNAFRSYGGGITHLKTFYAGLFQEIKKEDFLYEGTFIQKAHDLVYSIPISEMAGSHIRFIPDALYIYNYSYPFNKNKDSTPLEGEMDRYIRRKEKYEPLRHLPSDSDQVNRLPVYKQIQDIHHPTLQDYGLIQNYLSNAERENIERLGDMEPRMRALKIIGSNPDEFPIVGSCNVNCSSDDRENCLLLYSSFNLSYPKGLKRLLKQVKESDFKGHILYRMGGWPNAEGGSLPLCHVPYAFKASFFQEAKRVGFKRVLWLDTAAVPLGSLNEIFSTIEKTGHFVMGNSHMIGPFMDPHVAVYFGVTMDETYKIPSCSAGLFGLDFNNKESCKVLDAWYKAAHDKDAFFSRRSDQTALSIILYQEGIQDFVSLDRMPHSRSEIKPDSIFLLDREYVSSASEN